MSLYICTDNEEDDDDGTKALSEEPSVLMNYSSQLFGFGSLRSSAVFYSRGIKEVSL